MKQENIFAACCLLLSLTCGTAAAAEELIRSEYNYRHYGIADGLPTEIVECVFQDSRGFIWFGTEHGCVCFDGHTFKKYLANKSLPINKIEENEHGEIVIYGYYFIYILDVKTDRLRMTFRDRNLDYNVNRSPGLPRGYSIYMKRDTRKNAVFRLQGDTVAEFFSHPLIDEMEYGQSLYYDIPSRLFYIPSAGGKLYAVSLAGEQKAVFHDIYVCRFVKTKNELLAAGYDGVWKITPTGAELKYKFEQSIDRPAINSDEDLFVIAGADDNLVIRDNSGVRRCCNGRFETIIDNINIPRSLMFDREGNLWFTSRQGIYNFFKLDFVTYRVNAQNADIVYSIVPIEKDKVFIATGNGKLIRFGNGRCEELHYPRHPQSSTEFSYRSIRIGDAFYFTTYSDILKYKNGKFSWLGVAPEQYHVASCRLNEKEFAVGGWGKLFILDNEGNRIREISHVDMRRSTIYTVKADDKNRLWIGGHDGICRISETDTVYFFGENTMNAEASVKDASGRIWFSCESHIYYTDGDTIRLFMEFPNTIIANICYTQNNMIVVSDNTGIRIIDPESKRVVSFDYSNGYSSGEPSWNTMTEDYDGNIWLGTQGPNVLKFNPSKLTERNHKPLLYLTSAQSSANNVDMSELEYGASLTHSRRNVRFSYIGLSYSDPHGVRYRYRLTGFQDEWSQPSDEREVSFTNLSPGHYEFQVMAGAGTPETETNILSCAFSIRPAFWQTAWFWTVVALALMLLTAAVTLRIQQRRNRRLLDRLRTEKELNELRISSIRLKAIPHFNANVLAAIEYYIANRTKEEAMRILGIYSSFTLKTLGEVDRASRPLSDELAYVKIYLDLEKIRFMEKFDFQIDVEEGVDKSIQLPNMILHTYCENAVKHGLM
ncbi:MAG: histidine kinase, partial [Tannerella sp.]|nr:histidine kinase [Tannerella sp.]